MSRTYREPLPVLNTFLPNPSGQRERQECPSLLAPTDNHNIGAGAPPNGR
jgi:hypothetical protein